VPLGIKLYGMKGEWYQCVHVLKLSETLSESFLHTNGNNVSEIVSVILKSEHRIFILVFSVYFSPCHELDRKAQQSISFYLVLYLFLSMSSVRPKSKIINFSFSCFINNEFQNILNKKGVRANLDIFGASSTMSQRGEKHSVCHVGDTKMRTGPRPFVEDSVTLIVIYIQTT